MIYEYFIKIAMDPKRNAARMDPATKTLTVPDSVKRVADFFKRYSYENPASTPPAQKAPAVPIPQKTDAPKAAPRFGGPYGKAVGAAAATYVGYKAFKHFREKKRQREQAAAQARQPLVKAAAYKLDPTSRMHRLATVLKKHKEGSPMYDKVLTRGKVYASAAAEQQRGPLHQTMSVGKRNAQRQVATLFQNPGARKKSLVPLPTTGRFGAGHEVHKQKRDNTTSQAKHVGSWLSSVAP